MSLCWALYSVLLDVCTVCLVSGWIFKGDNLRQGKERLWGFTCSFSHQRETTSWTARLHLYHGLVDVCTVYRVMKMTYNATLSLWCVEWWNEICVTDINNLTLIGWCLSGEVIHFINVSPDELDIKTLQEGPNYMSITDYLMSVRGDYSL